MTIPQNGGSPKPLPPKPTIRGSILGLFSLVASVAALLPFLWSPPRPPDPPLPLLHLIRCEATVDPYGIASISGRVVSRSLVEGKDIAVEVIFLGVGSRELKTRPYILAGGRVAGNSTVDFDFRAPRPDGTREIRARVLPHRRRAEIFNEIRCSER